MAVRAGVAEELLKVSNTQVDALQFHRLVRRLYENVGIAEEFARWAVESWAVALGKELTDGLKQTPAQKQPATREPQDADAWVEKGG